MMWPDIQKNIGEVYENGVLPTMLYITRQRYSGNKVNRPLHSHDSICELLLVYKGEGTYRINAKSYPVQEGSVIFYNQGELHEISSSTDSSIGVYCIGMTNLKLRDHSYNHLVKDQELCVRSAGQMYSFLKDLCEQMYTLQETGTPGKAAAQLLCASMVIIAVQLEALPQAISEGTEEEQFVARIWKYLNEHYTEGISLKKIAESLGCSEPYVSHAFKKATGSTPIQYVIRRRIGLAQNLLISTDMTATQISTMVGYDNTNYFSTIFSKIVGMTPIKYRVHYLEELRGIRNQF